MCIFFLFYSPLTGIYYRKKINTYWTTLLSFAPNFKFNCINVLLFQKAKNTYTIVLM